MESSLSNMDAHQLCEWLGTQKFPTDIIESFRGKLQQT